MTEQERPRTEAEALIERLSDGPIMADDGGFADWDGAVTLADEALEQARTEGRQQAVREIADTLTDHSDHLPITSDGENLRCSPDDAILVAGLNASESPPMYSDPRYNEAVRFNNAHRRDASESPPTLPQHFVRAGQLPEVGDASESGQPPEASDE